MAEMAFEHTLGIKVTRKHKDGVTVEVPLTPNLFNSLGVLHGGITAAIADEAAWFVLAQHAGKRDCTTTELKINYLRPIAGKKVRARGVLLRLGRTLVVTRVDLFDDHNRLAAAALVTYMLL